MRTLAIFTILTLIGFSSDRASAKTWEIITVDAKDYVTADNVAKFYKINVLKKLDDKVVFRHPKLTMEWPKKAKSVLINRIKFNLHEPVILHQDNTLISVRDLTKVLDPVIRPNYVGAPFLFDTVIIDPGHGGKDEGAAGLFGTTEKQYNLDVALRLQKELSKRNFKAVLTRKEDKFLTLEERLAIAKQHKNPIFISIHHSSSKAPDTRGIQTSVLIPEAPKFQARQDGVKIGLATSIHAFARHELQAVDLGVSRKKIETQEKFAIPAVVYEGGYLSNREEATEIHKPEYRQRTAAGIAKAVTQFQTAVGKKHYPKKDEADQKGE